MYGNKKFALPDSAERAGEEFRNSSLLIAEGCAYSLDDFRTKLNNNVLIVGGSGCGKTRNIVIPNISQCAGSYVVSDPKGDLYKKYKGYLRKNGYDVRVINFAHPELSDSYNPLHYIKSTQDIVKFSSLLVNDARSAASKADPYWDLISATLLSAVIGMLKEEKYRSCTFKDILTMVRGGVRDNEDKHVSALSVLFERLEAKNPDSWACAQFKGVNAAPGTTYNCILSTLSAKFAKLDSSELHKMMSGKRFDFSSISRRKTAVFVIVSDTDRTMDTLANIFFTQAINALCDFADTGCKNNRLPIPVRFILDDFATNCRIDEFPRIISSIRSRGISVMLMIQSEAQLRQGYGADAATIISNCDTYAYIGGNDVETAESISIRSDRPLTEVLYMPVGDCMVFRRGSKPVCTRILNGGEYIRKMEAAMQR
ncbi:MAG: type IV secretory system conjugative DNA transfer family protein [Oscillospiraceae bacterium]|nr:type IV secretory system conjugative DNA transfer family protein [Oscillospiraceae bacterium]